MRVSSSIILVISLIISCHAVEVLFPQTNERAVLHDDSQSAKLDTSETPRQYDEREFWKYILAARQGKAFGTIENVMTELGFTSTTAGPIQLEEYILPGWTEKYSEKDIHDIRTELKQCLVYIKTEHRIQDRCYARLLETAFNVLFEALRIDEYTKMTPVNIEDDKLGVITARLDYALATEKAVNSFKELLIVHQDEAPVASPIYNVLIFKLRQVKELLARIEDEKHVTSESNLSDNYISNAIEVCQDLDRQGRRKEYEAIAQKHQCSLSSLEINEAATFEIINGCPDRDESSEDEDQIPPKAGIYAKLTDDGLLLEMFNGQNVIPFGLIDADTISTDTYRELRQRLATGQEAHPKSNVEQEQLLRFTQVSQAKQEAIRMETEGAKQEALKTKTDQAKQEALKTKTDRAKQEAARAKADRVNKAIQEAATRKATKKAEKNALALIQETERDKQKMMNQIKQPKSVAKNRKGRRNKNRGANSSESKQSQLLNTQENGIVGPSESNGESESFVSVGSEQDMKARSDATDISQETNAIGSEHWLELNGPHDNLAQRNEWTTVKLTKIRDKESSNKVARTRDSKAKLSLGGKGPESSGAPADTTVNFDIVYDSVTPNKIISPPPAQAGMHAESVNDSIVTEFDKMKISSPGTIAAAEAILPTEQNMVSETRDGIPSVDSEIKAPRSPAEVSRSANRRRMPVFGEFDPEGRTTTPEVDCAPELAPPNNGHSQDKVSTNQGISLYHL